MPLLPRLLDAEETIVVSKEPRDLTVFDKLVWLVPKWN